ncbi:hypothetical protein BH10BDE1_BH10BDE1_15320 [soil metagenome]
MVRHGSFDFLSSLDRLRASTDEEMTGPVTASLEGVVTANGNQLAVDWMVHVGGPLREQIETAFERQFQLAANIELELLMRPDPVVSFEVNAWVEKCLGPMAARCAAALPSALPLEIRVLTRARDHSAWISTVPAIAKFQWSEISATDDVDVDRFAEMLGLRHVVSEKTRRDFVSVMKNEVGLDLTEPPWMFWSRLAGWIKHRQRDADVSEIEMRLSFFRAALSPQDEINERESLGSGQVMMNPTFEAVERSPLVSGSREAPLLARARSGNKLISRTITSFEAIVLDQVRESFRSAKSHVIADVERDTGIRKEFAERAIEALIRDGFLLGRS